MNQDQMSKLVSQWPGVAQSVKWEVCSVFDVAGKMFAVFSIGDNDFGNISCKVDVDRFLEYTDRDGIIPAPYLARAHWVTMAPGKLVRDKELGVMLRRAYEIVRAKHTKKKQRELAD